MPCTSSHFSGEAARTNPSKLPRGWRPCPPQFADDNSGTVTFDQSGRRERRLLALARSEEHTSELQSLAYLVCRLLLEKKKNKTRQSSLTALEQGEQVHAQPLTAEHVR